MQLFPDMQTILVLGPFRLTWYATFILSGALIGYKICQNTMKKWGYSTEILDNYLFPVMFIGILGARLYYVIFQWDYYSQNPSEIIAIWHGGLAIYGGLIAGTIFSYFYFKYHKIDPFRMADLIMPCVLLAQGLGRWGNFMNQEAFGKIVPESFYAHFPTFIKNQMFIEGAYRAPTFLYESMIDILGFIFIVWIFRKYFYKKRGDCAFMYMIWYGIGRLIVEGMRTDSLMLGPFRVSQLVSIALIIIGVLGLIGIFHKIFHGYKKPVLLFDFDGTLVDSQPLIFETFRRVFQEAKPGFELSQEELYSFFGPPLEASFARYFDESEIPRLIDRYQEINLQLHDQYVKPMPHAKETLETLSKAGYPMAIISNKRIRVVQKGLRFSGLGDYFDVVLGKEDILEPKPSASGLLKACGLLHNGHDNVVYIGDNAADIIAAKNMAAYSIGYGVDSTQRAAMEKEKPCRMIDDLKELIDICKEERAWSDNTIW